MLQDCTFVEFRLSIKFLLPASAVGSGFPTGQAGLAQELRAGSWMPAAAPPICLSVRLPVSPHGRGRHQDRKACRRLHPILALLWSCVHSPALCKPWTPSASLAFHAFQARETWDLFIFKQLDNIHTHKNLKQEREHKQSLKNF